MVAHRAERDRRVEIGPGGGIRVSLLWKFGEPGAVEVYLRGAIGAFECEGVMVPLQEILGRHHVIRKRIGMAAAEQPRRLARSAEAVQEVVVLLVNDTHLHLQAVRAQVAVLEPQTDREALFEALDPLQALLDADKLPERLEVHVVAAPRDGVGAQQDEQERAGPIHRIWSNRCKQPLQTRAVLAATLY